MVASTRATFRSAATPPPTRLPLTSPPPGVAQLPSALTVLEPGPYWYFRLRSIVLTVGEGWAVVRREDDFFDIVRTDDSLIFVGIGRFPTTYRGRGQPVGATSVDAVVEALLDHPGLEVTEVGPASLLGFEGRTLDVRDPDEQTPMFGTQTGVFYQRPGLEARYEFLDVGPSVLEVWVAAPVGQLDTALEVTRPVIDALVWLD